MRALIKTASGEVLVTDREPRALTDGLVRVAVTATGVCGTDLHLAKGEYACAPPVTMGHEISGTVVEVGRDVDDVWLGKAVVCETYFSTCGACRWCRAGRRNLCPERRSLGSFEDGGFAASVVVPVANLHALPDHVDPVAAVLAEPLACVTHSLLDPPRVSVGDRVLVIGPGAMGLLAVQLAVAAGATVTCAGLVTDAQRLERAASYGARTTHTPPPDSYDVVIECSGAAAALRSAYEVVDRGGRVVQIGIVGRDVELPYDTILYKELEVSSGFASTATSWTRAMEMLQEGRVVLDGLVSHVVPLEEWERAFALVGSPEAVKVVVRPDH